MSGHTFTTRSSPSTCALAWKDATRAAQAQLSAGSLSSTGSKGRAYSQASTRPLVNVASTGAPKPQALSWTRTWCVACVKGHKRRKTNRSEARDVP